MLSTRIRTEWWRAGAIALGLGVAATASQLPFAGAQSIDEETPIAGLSSAELALVSQEDDRPPHPGQPPRPPRPPRDGDRRGPGGPGGRGPGDFGPPPPPPLMVAIDSDKDGTISSEEISKAAEALKTLDKNGDGKLTREELRPERPRHERGEGPRFGPEGPEGPDGPPPPPEGGRGRGRRRGPGGPPRGEEGGPPHEDRRPPRDAN